MADTGDIPEHLQCPICFEIPMGAVYQCAEGHTVCEICYPKLSSCPQCKLPFAERPIRNRVMETMLEKYKCPYKSSGCNAFVSKKSRQEHINDCVYNEAKFGKLRNICHHFGFMDCPFKMNRGNVIKGLEHFQTNHTVIPVKDQSILLEFPDIDKLFDASCTSNQASPPIIWHAEKERCVFIIKLVASNEGDGNHCLSFLSLYFRYDSGTAKSFKIEISMGNVESETKHEMFGSLSPFNLLEEKQPLIQSKHSFLFNSEEAPQNLFVAIKLKPEMPKRQESPINKNKIGYGVKPIVLPVSLFVTLDQPKCSKDPELTNFNAVCDGDGCQLRPLKGCFYKCLHCVDFDLCVNCILDPAWHATHVYALIKTKKQYNYFRSKCTPEGGFLPTYSMFNAPGAAKPKPFRMTSVPDRFHAQCDGCGVYPIKNRSYACLFCPNTDYCQKCVDADIHCHHILGLISNYAQETLINFRRVSGKSIIPCTKSWEVNLK